MFSGQRKSTKSTKYVFIALTGVEEEAVRVAGAEVEREVVAGGDDGPPAHLGEVVGEELAAGEGGLGRVQS